MATSSSDESSTAPKDFHLSSSLDSGSRLSPNRQKCPLCSNYRKAFYCKECIHNGNFCTSNSPSERYADKQLRLYQLKANRKIVEDTCLDLIEKKQKIDAVCSKIRSSKDHIQILRLALDEKKRKQQQNNNRLTEIKLKNETLIKSLPKYEERVAKLETYVAVKKEELEKSKEDLLKQQQKLKNLAKVRIQQLIQYIFPITKVQPKVETELGSSMESDMVTAIAEATHTTYIRDRWIYTDNSGELQYRIVAPTLPGTGNYSAYNVWVAQNKDAVPATSSSVAVEHNPAYSISAALTYTAQLVHVLAFYLDVRLPYKMLYSDFCSSDMSEQQFSRRVARLNANVLQLCFSQNTNISMLHPNETLHNILQLLDTNNSDLGRQGPMEVDAQMAVSLEQQLANDLQTSEDSDSEEGDSFPIEWEAVPHVQCPEATAGPINLQSTQTISTQQASSMAGGLVTSAAASIFSIWKGWTGR